MAAQDAGKTCGAPAPRRPLNSPARADPAASCPSVRNRRHDGGGARSRPRRARRPRLRSSIDSRRILGAVEVVWRGYAGRGQVSRQALRPKARSAQAWRESWTGEPQRPFSARPRRPAKSSLLMSTTTSNYLTVANNLAAIRRSKPQRARSRSRPHIIGAYRQSEDGRSVRRRLPAAVLSPSSLWARRSGEQ